MYNLFGKLGHFMLFMVVTVGFMSGCGGGGGDPEDDTENAPVIDILSIDTKALASATENEDYAFTLTASGGTGPYAWLLSTGVLPAGLTLDQNTGTISGTPANGSAGAVGLTLQVQDSAGETAARDFDLTTHAQVSGLANWTDYVSANDAMNDPPLWAKTIRNDEIENVLATLLITHDGLLVDHPGTSLGIFGISEYLDAFVADDGAAHKAAVKMRAQTIIDTLASLAKDKRIFWQMDNEISKEPLSADYGEWRTGQEYTGSQADPEVIPMYVEYYLAPTVEAIREIEALNGVDIPIMLGSLGNGSNQRNRDWYQDLIDYVIVGDYAPSLKGKRVADVVEYLSFHYTVGVGLNWESYLDEFRLNMLPLGSIRGMWSTEEIGRQAASGGRGAINALSVLGRYLHYWEKHGMSPDAGRVNWWGWQMAPDSGVTGTTGYDGLTALHDFMGDTPLTELSGATRSADFVSGSYQTFTYQSMNDPKKRVVFMLVEDGMNTVSVNLQTLEFDALGWGGDVTARLQVFSESGNHSVTAAVVNHGGSYTVTLEQAQALQGVNVGLLYLTQE